MSQTILHLIETSGPGGAETVFVELIRALDPLRWRCIAVLPPPQPHVPNSDWLRGQLLHSGIETIEISENHSFDVRSFARLARLVRSRRPALIHAHLFGSAVRAGLLSRLLGVPAIATLHGYDDVATNERHRALKFALVNRGLARVVFVSEPLRGALVRALPLREEFTTAIPNGVDTDAYLSADGTAFRVELGIPPAAFVVGSVGNLTPAKGIDVLLRAAAILKQRESGYRFVVVGDLKGEQGETLRRQRNSLGLGDDVTFAGFRSDVPRAMAAFDVYALTSRSEGFSIALVEAMASGLAVVATRCGGPEQIVEDGVTGLLVENGSAEAVANAVSALRASANSRARMGHAARRATSDRFSRRAQVSAYEALYDAVISRDGVHR